MKCKTLQIVWHAKEPVFTLDFCPNCVNTLATGGADKDIKIWEVKQEPDGSPGVAFTCSLGQATSAVNTLRFSPLGDVMASGGDCGEVLVWKPTDMTTQRAQLGQESDEKSPTWKVFGALRGHAGDVHDLAWSPDGSALVTGSVENVAMLWDVEARRGMGRLPHQHYVQGVSWDPLGHTVLTLSNDRTAKVYGARPPVLGKKAPSAPPVSSAAMIKDLVLVTTISKRQMADNNEAGGNASGVPAAVPPPGSMPPPPARHPLFQDENLNSFFRRPSWSPDGSFLVVPAGLFKADPSSPSCPTSYIFSRGEWSVPVAHLPSLGRPPIAVRFSPVLYRLRAGDAAAPSSHAWEGLPYRMVWAIATLDSIMVYDTQCMEPLVLLGGLHMAPITDLAWSSDGLTLAVSSMDGYCSLAMFEPGELGEPMPLDELPPRVAACVSQVAAYRFAERSAKAKTAVGKSAAVEQHAAIAGAGSADPEPDTLPRAMSGQKRACDGSVSAAPIKRPAQAMSTPGPSAQTGPCDVIALDQDEDMPQQATTTVAAAPKQLTPQPVTGLAVTTADIIGAAATPARAPAPIPQSGINTPGGPTSNNVHVAKRRIVPTPVPGPVAADSNSQGPFSITNTSTPARVPVTFTTSVPPMASCTAEGTDATDGVITTNPTAPQAGAAAAPPAQQPTQTTTEVRPKKRIVPVPVGPATGVPSATGTTSNKVALQPPTSVNEPRPLPTAVTPEAPKAPAEVANKSTPATDVLDVLGASSAPQKGVSVNVNASPAQPATVTRPKGMSLAMLAAQAGRQAASSTGMSK